MGNEVNRLVLEGLFGPVFKSTSTSELIDNKQLSSFKIKCLVLKYTDDICKSQKNTDYQMEMDFIVKNNSRNNFIKNLVLSLEGNSLVLFQLVEKHGKILYELIKNNIKDGRKVFFVSGETNSEIREDIRKIADSNPINIFFSFNDKKIICDSNDVVFLSDGSNKLAKDITIKDDIDDKWIKFKLL